MAEAVADGHRRRAATSSCRPAPAPARRLAYLVPAIALGPADRGGHGHQGAAGPAGRQGPAVPGRAPRPADFAWAVLKGRSNYLCRQRLRRGDRAPTPSSTASTASTGTSRRGPRSRRLAGVGRADDRHRRPGRARRGSRRRRAWAAVSVGVRRVPGRGPVPEGRGLLRRGRPAARAAAADVIVVNTHLYGAPPRAGRGRAARARPRGRSTRPTSSRTSSPPPPALELAGGRFAGPGPAWPARSWPTTSSSADLARRRRPARPTALAPPGAAAACAGGARRATWPTRSTVGPRPGRGAVPRAARRSTPTPSDVEHAQAAGPEGGRRRCIDDIDVALDLPADDVAWVEGPTTTPACRWPRSTWPPLLTRARVAQHRPPCSPAPPSRLAWPSGSASPPTAHDELDVGSPFDFAGPRAPLLRRPPARPPPAAATRRPCTTSSQALITAAGGRTLALFTSWRAMQAAAEALRPRAGRRRCSTQGDLPKPALLGRFADDEADLPVRHRRASGRASTCPGARSRLVTIDRLPFPRPDEPLLAGPPGAGPGRRPSRTIDLPRAATLLAQGAGRLIRTATDRGVVAVLDPRLATAALPLGHRRRPAPHAPHPPPRRRRGLPPRPRRRTVGTIVRRPTRTSVPTGQ